MAGRKKKKPCEWCESEFTRLEEHSGQLDLLIEIYPDNNILSMFASCTDESGNYREAQVDMPLEYCPMCGRKLGF